jgi:dTDP-4-dehydrorhamnose reductase
LIPALVTGCRGQLGSALVRLLHEAGGEPVALTHEALDIADEAGVRRLLEAGESRPKVLFNAAGFTHVDRCEREPEAAHAGNAAGPAVLAGCCASVGTKLVHVSTDYVFPGDGSVPYREDDPVGPVSTYGRTKLEGERAVLELAPDALVVRTSWVFGRGRNFIGTILEQAARRRRGEAEGPLSVVDDQTGRPTYARDLAAAILALVERGASGLYHVANDGVATWWELARFCLDRAGGSDLEIERVPTAAFVTDAKRPAWSVLDCSKAAALGVTMRNWREAVSEYLCSEDAPAAASELSR